MLCCAIWLANGWWMTIRPSPWWAMSFSTCGKSASRWRYGFPCAAICFRRYATVASTTRTEIAFSALEGEGDGKQPLTERYIQLDDYPLGRLLERELEHEIRRSVAALPAECRQVFLKSRFERKKYEEIAAELGISVNTVKYHIKNALARLHDSLGKYLTCLLAVFLA